jgi:hypothetical protein
MARSKPVAFGDLVFPTKEAARLFLKEMLNRYHPGDTGSQIDEPVLREALARHPECDEKIGVGFARFEVHAADYGTQCFWVRRTDGTVERFSYGSCL